MAYLRSFFIIFVCLMIGKAIQHYTQIAIPGSIIGMLVLFGLLSSGFIPSPWAMAGCHLLIRHMALLFVPVGVGLINYLDLLQANAMIILLSTLGSSIVVFIVLGLALQYKETGKEKGKA
ncbi:hypothetical protein C9I98_21420 [Photobacterium sanctipauli]|uniref:CidA/LrgA family protein n=1 Tax=Photobacterium sanctipauli TaxID=1342794 RepID=A0A2T3NI91_9GAMM|nr:CidA/LrgA family protein [Photobacterium sanctipauli]PSW14748.1 hypothetical protein C9I98_21420 [Photobacterium sanctipauli]